MQSDGSTRYVKVHPGADVAALHANGVALWEASRDGRLRFAVARPDRFDLDTHALWQHAIDGRLLAEGACSRPGSRARRAAPPCPRHADRLGPAARPGAARRLFAGPGSGRPGATSPAGPRPQSAPPPVSLASRRCTPRPVSARRVRSTARHIPRSGCRPAATGSRSLIFDGFALGDPELDIAVLQAEIEDERAPAAVSEAVAAGYEAAAGPLDPRVLTAHRAGGRLATARRRARAVRVDGPERAERALAQAVAVLDAAGA